MSDYRETGILNKDDIKLPDEERLKKGPVVILECVENIPCDPCVAACPKEAISMEEITDLPDIDFEDCIGCALCVTECPGLAIFAVDCSRERCSVTIPYEFKPVPEKGDIVLALDRKGDPVQKSEVLGVRHSGKTYGITLAVDKENIWKVRGLKVIE